jgi:hypothetical protein
LDSKALKQQERETEFGSPKPHDLALVDARLFVVADRLFLPSWLCFGDVFRDPDARRGPDALFPFCADVSSASIKVFARLIPSAADSKSYIAELLSAYCLTTDVNRSWAFLNLFIAFFAFILLCGEPMPESSDRDHQFLACSNRPHRPQDPQYHAYDPPRALFIILKSRTQA